MAFDRFVYWRRGQRPTLEQVQFALEDYVRDLATEVRWDQDRFLVTLPGMGSHPAARIADSETLRLAATEDRKNERWFEVCIGADNLDVITRRGDWITNAIATEFARICAQFWQGDLEMG
jgi:hypothetical protein